ncbi:MAG: hypothetical protein ABSF65_01365 [Candidatus Bathyarchaeia archaeon]|jgi:hypothetical protein
MSEVILDKSDKEKRRTCLVGPPETTRTHTHWPSAFSHAEDLTNECLLENKKFAVFKRLEHANEKLKDAREEINEAVLAALEMKETGDDIGNVDSKQAKEEKMGLQKKDVSINADFVIMKDVSLEERHREAEKPLYLARYE